MIRPLFALSVMASLLAACGSASEDAADQPAATTADGTTEIQTMNAADGWVELHALALPEPGQAVMTRGDTEIVFDISCNGPGEIDPDADLPSVMASRLFNAQFQGEAHTADGQRVNISGYRRVVNEEEARGDLRYYRYPGQDRASIDVTLIDAEDRGHSSFQGGPNDRNRDGKGLPMLHVQPDGSFTAVTELISAATMIPGTHEFHRDALAGAITLAGRCPGPWHEQPLPGGMRAMF